MTKELTHPAALKQKLVMTRQMTSLMDKAFLSEGPHLRRCKQNWVPAWVDDGHVVTGDDPKVKARRAIDDDGRLMWMVYHADKQMAYHSDCNDPVAAMEQAKEARALRKYVRSRWDDVMALRRDALKGTLTFTVCRSDAAAGGLCQVGTDWFMRRMGLGSVDSMSARSAAILGYMDPQVLHVLFAAALRQGIVLSGNEVAEFARTARM